MASAFVKQLSMFPRKSCLYLSRSAAQEDVTLRMLLRHKRLLLNTGCLRVQSQFSWLKEPMGQSTRVVQPALCPARLTATMPKEPSRS